MSYWSDTRLRKNLASLVFPHDDDLIDGASIRLRVGSQVFLTSDDETTKDNQINLSTSDGVKLRPGQFGLILTKETVKVPDDAIAFISMRAGYKMKGLINVSGFHVDPGWEGKLTFGVYNADPREILIRENDDPFLIFYADLDSRNEHSFSGGPIHEIRFKHIDGLLGEVNSPATLSARYKAFREDIESRYTEMRGQFDRHRYIFNASGALAAIAAGFVVMFISNMLGNIEKLKEQSIRLETRFESLDREEKQPKRKQGEFDSASADHLTPSETAASDDRPTPPTPISKGVSKEDNL